MHQINPAEGQRVDQRNLYAPLRRADEWPARRACNQNCNQGRACDCVPNVDTDEATMGEGGGVFVWPAITALCLFAVLLAVHLWSAA